MKSFRKIFKDFEEHLLNDKKPAYYFDMIFRDKSISNQYPFSMLNSLKLIDQSKKHHPEGNVWNHTMLVVNNAALKKELSSNQQVFMWSALLHDLGKVPATKVRKGRITAYDHDKMGEQLSIDFLTSLEANTDLIYKVSKMVRWHMQILYVVKNLPYANIVNMLSEVSLGDIALLSLCDRLGRGNLSEEKIAEEEKNLKIFIDKCIAHTKGLKP